MVEHDDVVRTMAGLRFFDGLREGRLRRLLRSCDEHHFPAGHRIVTEGLAGQEFFVVVEGEAVVTREGRLLAVLGPGDIFGEVGALGLGRRTASVTATTPLRCLCVANGRLRSLLLDNPRLALGVVEDVVRRGDAATGSAAA